MIVSICAYLIHNYKKTQAEQRQVLSNLQSQEAAILDNQNAQLSKAKAQRDELNSRYETIKEEDHFLKSII